MYLSGRLGEQTQPVSLREAHLEPDFARDDDDDDEANESQKQLDQLNR